MWVISNDPLWLHSHTQQLWLHWFFTEMQSELKGSMMPCSVIQRVLELGTSLLTGYGTVNILLFSCSVHSAHREVEQLGVPFPSLVFIDVLFRPCKCFEVNWQWIPSYQWLACHSSNLNSSCIAQMCFFKFYRLILEGNPSGYRASLIYSPQGLLAGQSTIHINTHTYGQSRAVIINWWPAGSTWPAKTSNPI